MAGTRILYPIYTVDLGCGRSYLVALWLVRQTLKPADQGRFLSGHQAPIIHYFFFFFFQLYDNELLPTSNINYINDKSTIHNVLY